MVKPKILLLGAAILAVGLLGTTPSARADSISLTVGNAAIASTGSGPYGSIDITAVNATTCGTVTCADEFQITVKPASGYVAGDSKVLALNFNTGNTGAITGANSTGAFTFVSCTYYKTSSGSCGASAIDSTAVTNGTGVQVDGFGDFNYVLDDGSGFSNPLTTFTIDIYTANNVDFPSTGNSLADLLIDNGDNAAGAVHLAPTDNLSCTGWVAGSITSTQPTDPTGKCVSAPEPSTGGMLAIGLLGAGGLGLIWRRRREDLV